MNSPVNAIKYTTLCLLVSIFLSHGSNADEDGSEVRIENVSIEWIEHSRFNSISAGLSREVNCGSRGTTGAIWLIDEHLGASKGDMLRVLLAGWLAGRQIDVAVVGYRTTNQFFCAIKRIRIR